MIKIYLGTTEDKHKIYLQNIMINYRLKALIVFFEITLVPKIAKATTETELIGIKIAATTGVILPDNA